MKNSNEYSIENYIDYVKTILKESKVELPTLQLQLHSLLDFMLAVGYETKYYTKFILKEPKPFYPKQLSLQEAVFLHNNPVFYGTSKGYIVSKTVKLKKPALTLSEASKAKIVETVYVQWAKRKKEWKVQKHIIKFVGENNG